MTFYSLEAIQKARLAAATGLAYQIQSKNGSSGCQCRDPVATRCFAPQYVAGDWYALGDFIPFRLG